MSENYRQYLDSVSDVLLKTRGGVTLSLTNIFTEFSVYENIFSHSLSGYVQIVDNYGLSNLYSFLGGEKVTIFFHTRSKQAKESMDFYVYRIGDVFPINDTSCTYRLYFTTAEAIANNKTRISKHMEGNISSMVTSLLSYLETEKKTNITQTSYIHDLIIPNMSPFKAINWLSLQAINADTGNSSFIFYEDLSGYNFVSIEDLVQQEPKIKYSKYQILAMSPDDPEYHDKMFRSVENEAFTDRVDTIKNHMDGIYSSRHIKLDILKKTFEYVDFDRDSVVTLEGNHTHVGEYTYELDGVTTVHSNRTPISSEKKNPQSRKSVIVGLSQNIARIMVSGNSDLKTGDVVEYDYPAYSPISTGSPKHDKYLTGKRLIIGIRHIVGKDGYTQVLELAKDSVRESVND